MREFKFRFFRTKSKEMFYGFEGCSIGFVLNQWDNEIHVSELMQYTGLKDKNGKEIYEGDILKCKSTKRKYDVHGNCFKENISYKNSVIEWWKSKYNLGYSLRDGKGKTLMIKPSSLKTMEVEVIGNIYENPELLEVTND